MQNSTKYTLIGVGVLALVGVGVYLALASKKKKEQEAPQQAPQTVSQGGAVTEVANKFLDKISGSPEVAQQRLANRRLRQSTRQAKLLKKGKITVDDLRKLQSV